MRQERIRKSTSGSRAQAPKPPTSQRPRISIIGAGRLGTTLGRALKESGYRIEAVVAVHAASARRAARLMGIETVALTSRQLETPKNFGLLADSDLLLLATPDDEIATVAERLTHLFKSQPSARDGSKSQAVAIHTSGALSSAVLRPLSGAGFAVGSLHPLVSVNSPTASTNDFQGAFFCLEGDRAATRAGRSIVRDLGGHSFDIVPEAKPLYHAAALTVSGQMVALFDIALEMLAHCGLSSSRARQVLTPLMESNLANLATSEPSKALTGTFARGDIATVKKHIAAMEKEGLPQALAAYLLLAQRSLSLAEKNHGNHAELERIARLLSKTARNLK